MTASWAEATARQRLALLLDSGSFEEALGPGERVMSPSLPVFDLPRAFDDGMVVGQARLDGRPVLVAAQEGRFMGGAVGEVHGAKLVGLLRLAAQRRSEPVLILFDTGGVRLQEANAGEVAVAEIMRAVVEARAAGVPVVGLIGGRAGCYGGGSLIAGCCSRLVMSEVGRLSVSGPEVIETNHGVEAFDSRDRALVWRTMGGKHRWLTGAADRLVDDTGPAFRDATIALLGEAPQPLSLALLRAEQAQLRERLARFGAATDALDVWTALGVGDAAALPELDAAGFEAATAGITRGRHDAR